jgi:hypothetical protein
MFYTFIFQVFLVLSYMFVISLYSSQSFHIYPQILFLNLSHIIC